MGKSALSFSSMLFARQRYEIDLLDQAILIDRVEEVRLSEYLSWINVQLLGFCRDHQVHLGVDGSAAKVELVYGLASSLFGDLFGSAEEESFRRAHGCAHRLLADGGAIVTHVALHHEV